MSDELTIVSYKGGLYAYAKGGHRKSLRTRDLAVAKQRLEDLKKQLKVSPTNVGEMVESYLSDLESQGRSSTKKKSEWTWKPLEAFFSHLRADQVDKEICRKYRSHRANQGISDGSIRRELGFVRTVVRFDSPHHKATFELPTEPDPKDRYLTRSEVKLMLEHADGHVATFIHLAIATGARMSALLELRWDQVDNEHGFINLGRGVGNKKRATVPLNSTVKPILAAAKKEAFTEFVIEYRQAPIKSVKTSFRATMRRARLLPPTGPKILRHSAAVWMANKGVSMEKIAQYLGHENSKVTERVYARYSPEYLRDAAEALEL